MIPRQMKVDLLVMLISLMIIIYSDQQRGLIATARLFRAYSKICRDLGNWAWTQSMRADNAYKELVTP